MCSLMISLITGQTCKHCIFITINKREIMAMRIKRKIHLCTSGYIKQTGFYLLAVLANELFIHNESGSFYLASQHRLPTETRSRFIFLPSGTQSVVSLLLEHLFHVTQVWQHKPFLELNPSPESLLRFCRSYVDLNECCLWTHLP